MGTKELLREIQRLPVNKRMLIIEQTLRSIRKSERQDKMEKAAEALLQDYRSDKELTEFTGIERVL